MYIGTIHPQHFDIAMMMLEHGKHVLCEKPLTMNLKQTTELIQCAKAKKRFLMEAVWSRCFPVYDAIKKELASGSLGDIHQVTVSFGFNIADVARLKFVTFVDHTFNLKKKKSKIKKNISSLKCCMIDFYSISVRKNWVAVQFLISACTVCSSPV